MPTNTNPMETPVTEIEFLNAYDPKSSKPLDVYFHGDEAVVIGVYRDRFGELCADLDVRDDDHASGARWAPVVAYVEELTFRPEA